MTQQLTPPQASVRQFWLVCCFALILLSFQTLGHVHRHAHAHGGSSATASLVKVSVVEGLGHQSGDLSCQLFDQLSQDQALAGQFALDVIAALPLLAVASVWASCSLDAHWKRGARGPPLLA